MPFKFTIQKKINDLCRVGCITEISDLTDNIETPATLLFFKNGTFPFLTPDIYDKIKHLPTMIQCPLNYIADKMDVLETFNCSLSAFIGKKGAPVIITQSDQSQEDVEGGLTRNSFSAWCTGGRQKVTTDDYFKIIKSCKPLMWQSPCDNETPMDFPSEKRLQKGVERTISFFKDTNAEITKQNIPGSCLTSFTGGMNWLRRRQCLERMLTPESRGIIIDGFHGSVPTNGEKLDQCMELIEKMNSRIQEFDDTKLIVLPKFNQPSQIVKAVQRGVDLFDGTLPYLLTSSKVAWIYTSYYQPQTASNGDAANGGGSSSRWLSMADSIYVDRLDEPLDARCECFSCLNHTKGYINHLIKTNELLAEILLMIHNCTQYYLFFHELRQAMNDGDFDRFHDWAATITCPQDLLADSKDRLMAQ